MFNRLQALKGDYVTLVAITEQLAVYLAIPLVTATHVWIRCQ